jgi:hypothetical protein
MDIVARVNRQKKTLVIEIPYQRATPSGSGKTLVVATTHGGKATNVRHKGRPVIVIASAFVYPEKKTGKNLESEDE